MTYQSTPRHRRNVSAELAASPRAGWYPEPDGSQHYWDGTAWTAHSEEPIISQFNVVRGGPPPIQMTASLPLSGKAIAAFVVSLFWLFGVGSIVAIWLAAYAMKDVRRGTHSGQGLAVAGLILGILGILGLLFVLGITLLGNGLNDQFNLVSTCLDSPTAAACAK